MEKEKCVSEFTELYTGLKGSRRSMQFDKYRRNIWSPTQHCLHRGGMNERHSSPSLPPKNYHHNIVTRIPRHRSSFSSGSYVVISSNSSVVISSNSSVVVVSQMPSLETNEPIVTASDHCLKPLKSTIDKINGTGEGVFSPLLGQNNSINADKMSQEYQGNILKMQSDIEPIDNDCVIISEFKTATKGSIGNAQIGTGAVNWSCISISSTESKVPRSPLCSINVSSYEKESTTLYTSSRLIAPNISIFHIDYSEINPSLLAHCSNDFFIKNIQCHCILPNPDQWNVLGVRACGYGQKCAMSQLKIECNEDRCPNETLCCNCQFQQFDNSFSKSHRVELFFDGIKAMSWTLRTKADCLKDQLLFEVSGKATMVGVNMSLDGSSPLPDIFITKNIKVSLKADIETLVYYLKHGSYKEANVKIERWLVDGHIRIGVFALNDISAKTEIVLFYRNDYLNVHREDFFLDSEDYFISLIQSLIYDVSTTIEFMSLLDTLLSPYNTPEGLDHFYRLGGGAILCMVSMKYIMSNIFHTPLLTKLIDVLIRVFRPKSRQVNILGVDLQVTVKHLRNFIESFGLHNKELDKLLNIMHVYSEEQRKNMTHRVNKNNNLDILNGPLPKFWCSRQCMLNGAPRKFFYHTVTKHIQWERPVYPWESNENDDANIYDYNSASLVPITHDDISQMYDDLKKRYEMKQKRILVNKTNLDATENISDINKKEIFKKRIMDFIVGLLNPYRNPKCRKGRITSDEDRHYLANKLSQTILDKELKNLNNVTDCLTVTSVVERKTRAYVHGYLRSRGSTYIRQ